MKLLELTIKPESGFSTPLKGDTLFGHFCWQAAYESSLLNGGLERWVACYGENPFIIFSSAWPKFYGSKTRYAFKKPDLPLFYFFKDNANEDRNLQIQERKRFQKKKWMLVQEDLSFSLSSAEYVSDQELASLACQGVTEETRKRMNTNLSPFFLAEFMQPHNTINRLTLTTGEGEFAPFSETSRYYYPETELAIFVLINEDATGLEQVYSAMERIGRFGYGRDASTGLGRFRLGKCQAIRWPQSKNANACYVMSPVVPERAVFNDFFFTPFVRFGKHGDILARSRNPFKNPVIMADEGGVFLPKDPGVFQKSYIGRAVFNTSKVMPGTIAQGYSIYLPFRLEMQNE